MMAQLGPKHVAECTLF